MNKSTLSADELSRHLRSVEQLSRSSKWRRLLHNPIKYGYAMAWRKLAYPVHKSEKLVKTALFYGRKMTIALPASTDIYLTGGKSHSSEIRLAKFLITNLKVGNHFLDIGAHYGYFTLIAAELVGDKGRVYAFEPSSQSFNVLSQNVRDLKHIKPFNQAVANACGNITFYEFSNLQSEYNSSDIAQFEKETWFKQAPPSKMEVEATTIDTITQPSSSFTPGMIKIDVEGAEYQVVQGGIHFLRGNKPQVVMEYLEPKRMNDSHRKALELFRDIGYTSYIINEDGTLAEVYDIDQYLETQKLESDNIVFKK